MPRIDGFLYSKSNYVIHFDPGYTYEYNYILGNLFNIISKYKIESIIMACRFIYNYNIISKIKKFFKNISINNIKTF